MDKEFKVSELILALVTHLPNNPTTLFPRHWFNFSTRRIAAQTCYQYGGESAGMLHTVCLRKLPGSLPCRFGVCRTHLEHKDETGGKMGEGDLTCPFFSCHNSLVIREEEDGSGADLPNDENGQKEGRKSMMGETGFGRRRRRL